MAEYLDEDALNVYTDGSSYSGPRRGGVGVRFVVVGDDGHEVEHDFPLPGYEQATSNMMELQAPIEALRALVRGYAPVDPSDYKKIVFWTDSRYVADNFSNAMYVWPRQRWMTAVGNPVANVDQWKELVKLVGKAGMRVEFEWVKGHKSSINNKKVDKLAKASAKAQAGRRLGVPSTVRRKLSPNLTEPGSVAMRGQVEAIRVIDATWMPQGYYRYRYEVMAEDSDFFQKVDMVYAERNIVLRPAHAYEVRFGDDSARPRIVEVIGELS